MASGSSQAFISHFFTERFNALAQQLSASRSPSAVAAAPPLPEALWAGSLLSERFLLRLCRRHDLATAADLFCFLLSEESFVMRAAEADATAAAVSAGGGCRRSYGGSSAPAAVPTRRRARRADAPCEEEDKDGGGGSVAGLAVLLSGGSCFAPDGVYADLVAALAVAMAPGPPGALGQPRCLFPSLYDTAAAAASATAPFPCAPAPVTYYSTGCESIDASLGGFAADHRGSVACGVIGGFRSRQVTELSGEAGTGKTLIALQAGLTYIVRRLAAAAVCDFFIPFGDDDEEDGDGDGEGDGNAWAAQAHPDSQQQRHPLRHYWPEVASLLRWLHGGGQSGTTAGCPQSITAALAAARDEASAICCLYLVSEDMPSARLATLAAGAVRAAHARLAAFFVPLLPSTLFDGLAVWLRSALTVEAALGELRVRPFGSLEDLLAMAAGGGGQGRLRGVIAALQRPRGQSTTTTATAPRRHTSPPGGGGGGVFIIDSIAAAAMQSSSDSCGQGPRDSPKSRQQQRWWRQRNPQAALLEAVGPALRALAADHALCVLVTNQVRGRVAHRRRGADGGGGGADLSQDPVMRLRSFHGFSTGGGGNRSGGGGLHSPSSSFSADSGGSDQVPALGLVWALQPHSRLFLAKAPSTTADGGGAVASRQLTLTAAPHAAPFTTRYAITADGMRVPSTD